MPTCRPVRTWPPGALPTGSLPSASRNVVHVATAYAMAAAPARLALERQQWAAAAALTVRPTDFAWDRFPHCEAITYFARAVGAARGGDAVAARRNIDRLQALGEALVQAKNTYWAEQVEIQRLAATGWLARERSSAIRRP